MHQPPSPMVKDYSWLLTDAANGTIPDQSNPKVIIVNEPQEDDGISQWDGVLGNPFTSPGDVVTGLHDHGNAPPPSQSRDGDDGSGRDGGFCNMVQSDPHSEILSNDSFPEPEGGYLVLYIPENFQGLFISKPGAPGIITCGYICTSLRSSSTLSGPLLHRR